MAKKNTQKVQPPTKTDAKKVAPPIKKEVVAVPSRPAKKSAPVVPTKPDKTIELTVDKKTTVKPIVIVKKDAKPVETPKGQVKKSKIVDVKLAQPVKAAKKTEKPKAQPAKVQTPKAPKLLTRPAGHIFTVTAEDINNSYQGKPCRIFLEDLPNNIITYEGFTLNRSGEAMFLVDMIMPHGKTQAMPRPMGTAHVANRLFAELVAMENNRGESNQISSGQQKATGEDHVLVTEVDVDRLIKKLPKKAGDKIQTTALKNPTGVSGGHEGLNLPSFVPANALDFNANNQNAGKTPQIHVAPVANYKVEILQYAKTLEADIMGGFQMRMKGAIEHGELKRTLDSCSKAYTYDIKNDGKGQYILITRDEYIARVPEDKNKFIVIN